VPPPAGADSARSDSGSCRSYVRCGATPTCRDGCRQCGRQGGRRSASSASRISLFRVGCSAWPPCSARSCISYVLCSVMPWCLRWLSAVLHTACARIPAAPAGIISPRQVAEPSRCAGGRPQAGRYRLTCSASPGPRVGSGGTVQVRRCRQLLRSIAAVRGPRAGGACAPCCRSRVRAGPDGSRPCSTGVRGRTTA